MEKKKLSIETKEVESECTGRKWAFAFTNADGLRARVTPARVADEKVWTVLVSHPKRDGGRELVEGKMAPIFFDFMSATTFAKNIADTCVMGDDGKVKLVEGVTA